MIQSTPPSPLEPTPCVLVGPTSSGDEDAAVSLRTPVLHHLFLVVVYRFNHDFLHTSFQAIIIIRGVELGCLISEGQSEWEHKLISNRRQ